MILKSIIEFKVSEESAVSTSLPSQCMVEVLDRLKIPYKFYVRCDSPRVWPRPLDASYYIGFQLNREIVHPESVHYMSEIIQGEAGLLCIAFDDCHCYSYRLIVEG